MTVIMATSGSYDPRSKQFTKVKLYFSCTELKSECLCESFRKGEHQFHEFFDKSPFAILYERKVAEDQGTRWTKIGHTEAALVCINPKVCNFLFSLVLNHSSSRVARPFFFY